MGCTEERRKESRWSPYYVLFRFNRCRAPSQHSCMSSIGMRQAASSRNCSSLPWRANSTSSFVVLSSVIPSRCSIQGGHGQKTNVGSATGGHSSSNNVITRGTKFRGNKVFIIVSCVSSTGGILFPPFFFFFPPFFFFFFF